MTGLGTTTSPTSPSWPGCRRRRSRGAAPARQRRARVAAVRPAAAAVRSAGLEPVGEVFGCIVMGFGWSGGPCGYGYGWNTTFPGGGPVGGSGTWAGRLPGTVGGGIAGGTSHQGGQGFRTAPFGGSLGGGAYGYGIVTPVVVSGDTAASRFAWGARGPRPWTPRRGPPHARRGARARRGRRPRHHPVGDPTGVERRGVRDARHRRPVRRPRAQPPPRHHPLGRDPDGRGRGRGGVLGGPAGVAFGYSLALKHEDWQLRQQRSTWTNQEVDGLTELLGAARADARRALARQARTAAAAAAKSSSPRPRCGRSNAPAPGTPRT